MQWKNVLYLMLMSISGLFLYQLPIQEENLSYLLSSLIQSLSTIFALFLTIILVLIQISDDRHLSFKILLDKKTLSFMGFFIFTILFMSAGLLNCWNLVIYARFGIIFSGTCFFLLIPYFWSVAHKIDRTYQLRMLEGWSESEMDKLPDIEFTHERSREPLEPLAEHLRKIRNLGYIAYKEGDDKNFGESLKILLSLASMARSNDVMETTVERLAQLGKESERDVRTFLIFASRILEYIFTGQYPVDLTSLLVDVLNEIGIETRDWKICSVSIETLEEIRDKTRELRDVRAITEEWVDLYDDLLKMTDEEIKELNLRLQVLRSIERQDSEILDFHALSSN